MAVVPGRVSAITSLETFLRVFSETATTESSGWMPPLFRGQPTRSDGSSFPLLPRMLRLRNSFNGGEDKDGLIDEVFSEIAAYFDKHLPQRAIAFQPRNPLEVAAVAAHAGKATPLMDFTPDPDVALSFALAHAEESGGTAELVVIRPSDRSGLYLQGEDFERAQILFQTKTDHFIYQPKHGQDNRMDAQRGVFVVFPEPIWSSKNNELKTNSPCIREMIRFPLELPSSEIKKIRGYLKRKSICPESLGVSVRQVG